MSRKAKIIHPSLGHFFPVYDSTGCVSYEIKSINDLVHHDDDDQALTSSTSCVSSQFPFCESNTVTESDIITSSPMLCWDSLSTAAISLLFDFEVKADFLRGSIPKSVACLGPVDFVDADKDVDSRSLPFADAPVNEYSDIVSKDQGG